MEKTQKLGHIPLVVAVPTTTLIIADIHHPEMVIVFDSNGKHGNKKVLPGGRVKIGQHSWLETGLIESKEEVSISDLEEIKFFAICSQPGRDVRPVTLEKYLDGALVPAGIDQKQIKIQAHHGFDVVLTARTRSQPKADQNETCNAYFVNVLLGIDPNEYALDHGHLLIAYADYLTSGVLPALGRF